MAELVKGESELEGDGGFADSAFAREDEHDMAHVLEAHSKDAGAMVGVVANGQLERFNRKMFLSNAAACGVIQPARLRKWGMAADRAQRSDTSSAVRPPRNTPASTPNLQAPQLSHGFPSAISAMPRPPIDLDLFRNEIELPISIEGPIGRSTRDSTFYSKSLALDKLGKLDKQPLL